MSNDENLPEFTTITTYKIPGRGTMHSVSALHFTEADPREALRGATILLDGERKVVRGIEAHARFWADLPFREIGLSVRDPGGKINLVAKTTVTVPETDQAAAMELKKKLRVVMQTVVKQVALDSGVDPSAVDVEVDLYASP